MECRGWREGRKVKVQVWHRVEIRQPGDVCVCVLTESVFLGVRRLEAKRDQREKSNHVL